VKIEPKLFGIFWAAFGLGFILGPAISLLAAYFFRSFFFLSGGIALVALLITIFFHRDP